MKAKCKSCGRDWIIFIFAKIGRDGYECPHCEYKRLYLNGGKKHG